MFVHHLRLGLESKKANVSDAGEEAGSRKDGGTLGLDLEGLQ